MNGSLPTAVVNAIERAAKAIRDAEAMLITAGAGMSVDSGLPDYRGNEGFWNHYPAYRAIRADYAAMTRPSGFEKDPAFAWGFYGHCLNLYRKVRPHEGYFLLKGMAERMPSGFFVLTTNVDGLFLKAGFSPEQIRECHGSLHRLQCIHPCQRETWSADSIHVEVDPATMRAAEPLPRCKFCESLARPAAFAFGDTRYVWESTQDQADRYQQWKVLTKGRRLIVIECGSGPTVPGLRREGIAMARETEGQLIRINPGAPEVDRAGDISIAATASIAFKEINILLQQTQL